MRSYKLQHKQVDVGYAERNKMKKRKAYAFLQVVIKASGVGAR
jgi:hypothetical protein